MYFFDTNTVDDQSGIITLNQNTNLAQADYIAKIVDFNGTFYIEKDGKSIQTSNINNWDIVVLKASTQIVFHINSWTKAKIIGPAKFTLQKNGNTNNYKLNLIYGDYVEMQSLQQQSHQKIQVNADGIIVSQADNKPINFQFMKQGKSSVIANKWSQLLVTQTDGSKTSTSVYSKQVLAIQGNDISLFDSFDKFAKAVKTKDLSQTFTYNQSTQEIASTWEEQIKAVSTRELLKVDEQASVEVNSEVKTSLMSLVADTKTVISPDQDWLLKAKLDPYFVGEDLKDLAAAQTDEQKLDVINALNVRIQKIFEGFNISYNKPSGSVSAQSITLQSSIKTFIEKVQSAYFIPTWYITTLNNIKSGLAKVK